MYVCMYCMCEYVFFTGRQANTGVNIERFSIPHPSGTADLLTVSRDGDGITIGGSSGSSGSSSSSSSSSGSSSSSSGGGGSRSGCGSNSSGS